MNIVVFIKQVPDTDDVKWTENNNIDRTNTESILNPADRQALETALNLKQRYGAFVSAVSMGPYKSLEILKEAIALGVDDALLLSDSKFIGSDTCATSKVLAACIKEKFLNTNLILFGQSALDGETAQTGPSTAVRLSFPFINNVCEIKEINENNIIVISENESEKITYKVKLPAVLCINNSVYGYSIPKIEGYIRAHDYNYKIYNISELRLKEEETGVKGSPTYVSKVYKHNEYRNCRFINTDELLNKIKEVY